MSTPFEKLKRDGKVAVLVSHGYGAGWSTWNTEHPGLVFDRELVEAVEAGDTTRVVQIAEKKYPGAYVGGADGLRVHWVTEGHAFEIEEYDGAETLHVIGQRHYLIA